MLIVAPVLCISTTGRHCKGGPAPCGCSAGCRKPRGTRCRSAVSNSARRLTDGEYVRLAPGLASGGGCLKPGKVGRIIVDDHSNLPYKVRAPDGTTFWYKEEQLVKDTILQRNVAEVDGFLVCAGGVAVLGGLEAAQLAIE